MASAGVTIDRSPQKILVIKICCLGDVVFLTPALRALRNRYPKAHIALLTSSWVRPIASQIPFLDELIIYDAPLNRKRFWNNILESISLLRKLRNDAFDVCVCGHRNKLFTFFAFLAGIPNRIGFADQKSWLVTHSVPFDTREHEIKRYLALAGLLGVQTSNLETEVAPLPAHSRDIEKYLLNHSCKPDDTLIGIMAGGGNNPGTTMPIKRWDARYYSELCTMLVNDPSNRILLLGGQDDRELNEMIRAGSGCIRNNIMNIAGELPLEQLPTLLKTLHIVLGGDTGPMHLAAAVGTPTVFLFGPSDPRLVAPIAPTSVYLWKKVECSPCYTPETVQNKHQYRGNEFICRVGTHECLKALTVGEVFDSCSLLLQQTRH
jgi:lipopolysaccharide heptosyltransferase II